MPRVNKTGIDWSDKEQVNAYRRDRHNNNPRVRKQKQISNRKRNEKRYLSNKAKAIEYTGGKQCHGKNCPYIKHSVPLEFCQIDFHHVVRDFKTADFNHIFRHCTWERAQKEIDNCEAVPLCACCHRLEDSSKGHDQRANREYV